MMNSYEKWFIDALENHYKKFNISLNTGYTQDLENARTMLLNDLKEMISHIIDIERKINA